jgi:hypothetical protein
MQVNQSGSHLIKLSTDWFAIPIVAMPTNQAAIHHIAIYCQTASPDYLPT